MSYGEKIGVIHLLNFLHFASSFFLFFPVEYFILKLAS